MKRLNKFYYSIFCLLFFVLSYAAPTVNISQISVNNQPISGTTISFNYQESITVLFFVQVNNAPMGNSNDALNIYYQKTSSSSPIVPVGGYGGNSIGRWFSIVLRASDFNASGGIIFAQFASNGLTPYRSSNLTVIKPAVPPITNNTLSGNQTIFYGQNATITGSTPSGGSGNYVYEWQQNVGGNWSNMGTLGQSINVSLTQTTQFRRIVSTYGGGLISSTSNVVTVTVNNSLPITNNTISGNQTINEGDNASQLIGSSVSGGSGPGSYQYIWQKKNANGSWSDIANSNTVNYWPGTPFFTSSYRRIVKSGNATDSISNEITVTVIPAPPIENNIITINGSIVTGSLPTGGTGRYVYSWVVYFQDTEIEPIILPYTTQSITIPANIYNLAESGIFIYRKITSASQISGSNQLQIIPATEIQNNTIAVNGIEAIGNAPTGGTGTYTYTWTVYGAEPTFTLPLDTQSITLLPYLFDLAEAFPGMGITRTVNSGNKVSVSNFIALTPLDPISNNTITLNGSNLIGNLPAGGYGGQYTYEWWGYNTIDGEVIGEVFQLSGTGQSNYIQNTPGLPTNYYRVVKSGNKVSYSNTVSYFPSRRSAATPIKKAQDSEPKIYPNPTTKTVNFETGLAQTTTVEIVAYNEFGINTVVFKGDVNPGQVIEWEIPSNYPKGLYFYKILSGNEEIKTGKIVYQ